MTKTAVLSGLKEEQARYEGYHAGVMVKDIRAKQEKHLKPDKQVEYPELEKGGETEEESKKISPDINNVSTPMESMMPYIEKMQVPSLKADTFEKIQQTKSNISELNLGKYVMGILAAILTFIGAILLGTMIWEGIPNFGKALILFLSATPMVFLPFLYLVNHPQQIKNGFLTSLMGAGLSVYYITFLLMGVLWNLITDGTLFLSLLGLIALSVILSAKITSNTLLIVSYIGNLSTYFLLLFKDMTVSQAYVSLTMLLITTVFLMLYSLTRQWTMTITKSCSVALGFLVVMLNNLNLMNAWDRLGNPFLELYQVDSPLYGLLVISFLFSFLLGVIIGKIVGIFQSRCLNYPILLVTYVLFSSVFYETPLFTLLLIGSTFLLNENKNITTRCSALFVIASLGYGVYEIVEVMELEAYYEWILCNILTIIAIAIYFIARKTDDPYYFKASLSYSFVPLFGILFFYESVLTMVLLGGFFGLIFYDGYEKCNIEDWGKSIYQKLLQLIPIGFLLARCLSLMDETIRNPSALCPIMVLILVMGLLLFEYCITNKNPLKEYLIFLETLKGISFILASVVMIGGIKGFSLTACGYFAMFLLVVHGVLTLFSIEEPPIPYPLYVLQILGGLLAVAFTTAMGEVLMVSSIIILSVGTFSIIVGFVMDEECLRKLGLQLSIIAVLKLVIVDVASSDTVLRLIALIIGALLCFGISCLYNKLGDK